MESLTHFDTHFRQGPEIRLAGRIMGKLQKESQLGHEYTEYANV